MRRGEVRLVEFGPARGSEAAKFRPAVIVSNDAANATASRLGRGVVTVVPITSNLRRVLDFQVQVSAGDAGLDRNSKVQAEQIRAVAVERVGRLLGPLSAPALRQLDNALRLHLAL
jgi:mRNA interferase MazF